MAPIIELQKVCFSYPGQAKPVFDDLDFACGENEVGIIGPNGSGKTTLLHLLIGIVKPQKGRLLFHGKVVDNEKELRSLRQEVGFLFQNSDDQLFCPTVIEDVAFGPLNLGLSPEQATQRATETLERLGLHGFEQRITHRLSGGEKKLVGLATILAMQPRVLLLDEPTNNLDPKTRERLIAILKELDQQKYIISHDWDFLSQTTTTLYQLQEGKLTRCETDQLHTHHHIHKAGAHPHHH